MFTRNQLKIFMILLMTLDHIPLFVGPELSTFFHAITRCVAVFFAYMLVEGFHYTRSKSRYLSRLYFWSLIMAIGNQAINFITQNPLYTVQNNIFLTLAVAATLLWLIDTIKTKTHPIQIVGLILIGLLLLAAGSFLTEGGIVVLPFTLITYLTFGHTKRQTISYLLLSLCFFLLFDLPGVIGSRTVYEFLMNFGFNSSWLFITVVPFLRLYNGELGTKSFFSKYLFYLYYPLHLWAIALASYFLEISI
ncbi:MAG: TraX family protein [Enterococcus sp.]